MGDSNQKRIYTEIPGRFLVTGGAGFIGFHLCRRLLENGYQVTAVDNMNSYYEVGLKYARLEILKQYSQFQFFEMDISDKDEMNRLFSILTPQTVVHLAAQAGVRYSIENPDAYVRSNLLGFFHVLECCRSYPVRHLIFASSSSVYGGNSKTPHSVEDKTDKPVSLYAATKKSNELLAYSYSKLYGIPATGLRFFTVYGPYGRPDMAYYSFTKKILEGEPIQLFNYGDMYRDFTYVDDIIKGLKAVIEQVPKKDENGVPFKVYNIGNSRPEKLLDFVGILEECLGKKAAVKLLPMQPGDVYQTYADIGELQRDFGFRPDTPLRDGMERFTDWYCTFFKKGNGF